MKNVLKGMEYNLVICGGTFDRLHDGHKAFLRYAFSKGENILIGLTSDAYVAQNKKSKAILPFTERLRELEEFLRSESLLERAKIVSIDTKFDQTHIPESTHTALLVSEETQSSVEEIQQEREKNNLPPLSIIVFPLVKNESGTVISSTGIRQGIVNREGVLLPDKKFLSKKLFLTDSVREILHEPFGILFSKDIPKQFLRDPKKIVTVGDVATKRIHELGVAQQIAVIDFMIERKKTQQSLSQLGFSGNEKIIHLTNPAGSLSPVVWKKLLPVAQHIHDGKQTIIIVEGEEDLLVIPLILTLPLGIILMYGQPALSVESTTGVKKDVQEGIVILEITEKLKQQAYTLLARFVPN